MTLLHLLLYLAGVTALVCHKPNRLEGETLNKTIGGTRPLDQHHQPFGSKDLEPVPETLIAI